jgi:hypothetical protein
VVFTTIANNIFLALIIIHTTFWYLQQMSKPFTIIIINKNDKKLEYLQQYSKSDFTKNNNFSTNNFCAKISLQQKSNIFTTRN